MLDTKYKQSKLYVLIDERDNAICYVGVTLRTLEQRLRKHKTHSLSWEMGQWISKHPVKIELVGLGCEFEEWSHIALLLCSGKMLFNIVGWPKLTAKQRRTLKAEQVQWARDRHADVLPEERTKWKDVLIAT